MKTKKILVLSALFLLPLVFYIFLLTGTNNFAKLPVLTEKVNDIAHFESLDGSRLTLNNNITVIVFFGSDLDEVKSNANNLNEKIYKHFFKFKDFQFIAVLPDGAEDQASNLIKKLGAVTDMQKWKFAFGSPEEILGFFTRLKNTSFSKRQEL